MPLIPERGPLRVLATATLVNTFGNGLMITTAALYFTRIVGLTPVQVGIGLSGAGLVGLLAGVPLGHIADRVGPREMQIAFVSVIAVMSLAYVFVGAFWQFVTVACVIGFFDAGTRAARGALIARAVASGGRVYARSYLRSVTNIGITLGAALAGVALHLDTPAAYKTLIVVDAITYAVTAVVLLRLPSVTAITKEHAASPLQALRDRPYVAMVVASGMFSMHFGIAEIGIPLWLVSHTEAPRTLVSVLLIINTVAVVLLQVRVGRRVVTPAQGARSMAIAGWVLLGACVLFASAEGLDRWWAVGLLVAGALVHVYAEILGSAGTFCLTYELAPEHAQGQYQGLAGTGMTMAFMLSPSLIAFLPLGMGKPGWIILGVVFVAAGAAQVPITRWAERTRERFAEAKGDELVDTATAQ